METKYVPTRWVDEVTPVCAENLNNIENYITILDKRTRSKLGDVIVNSEYDTMDKVVDRYGGKFWSLLAIEDGIFYKWWRTDEDLSKRVMGSYVGYVVAGPMLTTEKIVKDLFGGDSWELVQSGPEYVWVCKEHTCEEKQLRSFEGQIILTTLTTEAEVIAHHGGTKWVEIPRFGPIKQWVCEKHNKPFFIGSGSALGALALSTNVKNEFEAKQRYDGSLYSTHTWELLSDKGMYQWVRTE